MNFQIEFLRKNFTNDLHFYRVLFLSKLKYCMKSLAILLLMQSFEFWDAKYKLKQLLESWAMKDSLSYREPGD